MRDKFTMSKSIRKSNINRQDWFKSNPFFDNKDGYDMFIKTMMEAAKDGNLPIMLEHQQPEPMNSTDIKLLAQRVQHDTGLSVEFRFSICNRCDRLHCFLIIDASPKEEMENDDE